MKPPTSNLVWSSEPIDPVLPLCGCGNAIDDGDVLCTTCHDVREIRESQR
jgi:hypothetical protein